MLLVDDDPETVEDMAAVLERFFKCVGVSKPDDVVPAYLEHRPDVVLLDIMFGDDPVGYDLLEHLQAADRHVAVFMWSEDARMDTGLTALSRGAFGVLRKTPRRGEIIPAIEACLRGRRRDILVASPHTTGRENIIVFVHVDESTGAVVERARRLADEESPVLVAGEPGVGRERLAREIHAVSVGFGGLFVRCDCRERGDVPVQALLFGWTETGSANGTVLHPGLCEAADGGVLFLRDADALPATAEQGLLELLDEGRYTPVGDTVGRRADVRVIASTSHGRDDTFSSELLGRLGARTITVPPLRERPADIRPLVAAFVAARAGMLGRSLSLSDGAVSRLESASWPGNVAQLRAVVERACDGASGGEVTAEDVEKALVSGGGAP
ncbi:MAG: response regulator [Candidatus Eisenbacteria bacterium]|nr:response regulator [Candidatus Eisenbacteria bacterium]